jgi:hypothetical protein
MVFLENVTNFVSENAKSQIDFILESNCLPPVGYGKQAGKFIQ